MQWDFKKLANLYGFSSESKACQGKYRNLEGFYNSWFLLAATKQSIT